MATVTSSRPHSGHASDADSSALTRVAIAGATGYAGQELVRILARHPHVRLTAAMSSGASSAPRPLPALARLWEGTVVPLDLDRLVADADVVFLALPEAASAEIAPALLERGRRVIDLSGAFRIRTSSDSCVSVPRAHKRSFNNSYDGGRINTLTESISSLRTLAAPCTSTSSTMSIPAAVFSAICRFEVP